ncbi:MAG TPA: M1 family metallopeptidase [Longimicrobiales bacterium]|nr:M1 family metallopeptidase [Longimicrobiales bacterium]
MHRTAVLLLALVTAACSSAPEPVRAPAPAEPSVQRVLPDRPLPQPVLPPAGYQQAIRNGTRTETGAPGPSYWQQRVDYTIEARVDPEAKLLTGSETIRYENASPDDLPVLVLNLIQNFHAEGAIRNEEAEVTGGVALDRVAVNGSELGPSEGRTPGFLVEGTVMYVVLPQPVASGSTAELEVDWSFRIPQAGAGARMGYSEDELLYLGYWFPQMAVYDDVIGWHVEPFRGNAEFYSDFGDYELAIDMPAGWTVMATGTLQNPEEVLRPEVVERLREAESSDEAVRVLDHGQDATRRGTNGRLVWRFSAEDVRDVAFSATRNYAWDAMRSEIGDRDGDGAADYTRVDAFWREYARFWDDAARYSQHSLDFFSRFTGLPYPWPHMTAVEGGGIIGGGMEFPMMTLIGDYNAAGDSALYNVIAHELAHMWQPMALSTNERRYAWFDEGMTTFQENNARTEFYPGTDHYTPDQETYLRFARAGQEGPIMRWSDFHYPGPAYVVASYPKPASVLHALRGMLGEDTFNRAFQEYFDRWAFRHPYPWDMFRTFEDVSGEDLEWFWRSWYYESTADGAWYLDQAIGDVQVEDGTTTITVRDQGWVPMPVHLTVHNCRGEVLEEVIPVDRWLEGDTEASVTVPCGDVSRVEIDPEGYFPDANRGNNVWTP